MIVTADRTVVVVPPVDEPLTLEQLKIRAGQDWTTGDPRDALLGEYLAAARVRVERDTEFALLTQTRDAFARGESISGVQLAGQCLPLQSIVSVSRIAADGARVALPYTSVDLARGRIALAAPVAADANGLAHVVIRLIAGWLSPVELAAEAPLLVHAVGLLATHYYTIGRDVAIVGTIVAETPYGYDDAVMSYRQIGVV